MPRLPTYTTGDPAVDTRLVEVLDAVGAERDRDQLFEVLVSGVRLAADRADRLDLKIANAALKEMRAAYNVFAPYREVPKVTIFGSARTRPEDPLYTQTTELARAMADRRPSPPSSSGRPWPGPARWSGCRAGPPASCGPTRRS